MLRLSWPRDDAEPPCHVLLPRDLGMYRTSHHHPPAGKKEREAQAAALGSTCAFCIPILAALYRHRLASLGGDVGFCWCACARRKMTFLACRVAMEGRVAGPERAAGHFRLKEKVA